MRMVLLASLASLLTCVACAAHALPDDPGGDGSHAASPSAPASASAPAVKSDPTGNGFEAVVFADGLSFGRADGSFTIRPLNSHWDFGKGFNEKGLYSCSISLHHDVALPKVSFGWHDGKPDIMFLLIQDSWKPPGVPPKAIQMQIPGRPTSTGTGRFYNGAVGFLLTTQQFALVVGDVINRGSMQLSFPGSKDAPWVITKVGLAEARQAFEVCVQKRLHDTRQKPLPFWFP